jgi:tRNA-2-methylthio-N6-dimethylallyladenosine synthase
MSERVIQAVADNPRIMPSFHIPFQSGDNEILNMMRRGYSREKYLHIVNNIRRILPDAAITADCIVGFPGETDEQYENSMNLLREVIFPNLVFFLSLSEKLFLSVSQVKFETVYTAAYSPRPATPAAIWTNQVADEIKQKRLQQMNELLKEHALERTQRFLGRIQPVLIEDINVKKPSQILGRNPHSRLVCLNGNYQELRGKIVNVKMIEAKPYYLIGELCDTGDGFS